ncbi:hypothetical protein E2320_008270, partial [Naja naja]
EPPQNWPSDAKECSGDPPVWALSELRGAVLKGDGHQVVLQQIPDWNDVQLIVNGETVFQCNINDLDFGGDGKLDPLCQEAREAVLKAY